MSIFSFRDIVIDSRTGLNPRKNFKLGQGKNYYITIKDIHDGRIIITDKTDRIDDEAISKIKKRSRIKNGDILFTSIGRIGETAIVNDKNDTWEVNESIFIFTINTDIIDTNYFCILLQSKSLKDRLSKDSSGSTFKSIKMNQLEKLTFDIPNLYKQKQIVVNIKIVSKVINLCNTILNKLDTLVKSRFVEMFGDPILNPKGWEMTTIGEIVTEVKYGTSRPAIDGGKYAYLRMNNLTYDGYLDLADLKRIDIPDSEIEKCIVRKGDVLFNRTNSIELVGKTCVFDKDEDMIIAGYIIRVRLKPVMLPLIMSYFMNTDALKKKLRSMAKGAVNQANINAQELKAIKIYLPPTDLQQQFADFVAQTDKSKYCLVGEQILGKAEMLIELLNQEYFG